MNQMVRLGFVPQAGPQMAFIQSPCDITIFGGSRGGGKTYAALGDFFIHAEDHGMAARGLMVRKTREDLKDTQATALLMYGNAATWRDKGSFFEFHNGARLYLAYLENDRDAEHYQGWSLTRVYIEELTQFPSDTPVLRLLATLRSPFGIRCQMKCSCNPGGVGHAWVKQWAIDEGAYNVVSDAASGITRVFIPSRITDNPALLANDPGYVNRLKAVGSPQLVRAWLEGDWNVIEGAFFPEFTHARHVITPFTLPKFWTRFRAADWGSAKPFSIGWYAVVQDDLLHDGRILPRNSLVRYREWYGCGDKANTGLKLTAEEVARGIVSRETNGEREPINYGVLDPAAFAVISGPSIGETFARAGVPFRRADNSRISRDKRSGGWDQLRNRLKGDLDGRAMLFMFATSKHLIRTLPLMQHDANHAEDLDTEAEDHAVDELRYACMSRPYTANVIKADDRNPLLVRNAFRFDELGD